jgi:hypothetical protein
MSAITEIPIILKILLMFVFGACSANNSGNSKEKTQPKNHAILFHRQKEPNENAFSFLLPQNWTVSGGITRVDPNSSGGSGNAIEAKLYLKLSSPDEMATICWLPDTRFYDMQRCPTRNLIGSMFPTGSNYNGMMVLPILNPEQFVLQVAIPFAHPHAQQVKIVQIQALPELAAQYRQLSVKMLSGYAFNYTAGIATIEYNENTISYLEKMVCVIEDYGQAGAGLWGNKETWYVRTEKGKLESMAPVFATIGQSVKLNPEWISREIRSQQTNSQIAIETQRYVANIDKEITEHRARTNAEINNDMYLNLTGQEEYTNPFTGETERGTNEWIYRWENELGDVIYSDNQSYSPNSDNNLQIKGFKRSEIRKRSE